VSSPGACARKVWPDKGAWTEGRLPEKGSAEAGAALAIAAIAPESTAAACRKFDREAVSLGDGREYVVIFACILVWSLLTALTWDAGVHSTRKEISTLHAKIT
jgi:hypothetical protein